MEQDLTRRDLFRWRKIARPVVTTGTAAVLATKLWPQQGPEIDHEHPPDPKVAEEAGVDLKLCELAPRMQMNGPLEKRTIKVDCGNHERAFECVDKWCDTEDKDCGSDTGAKVFAFRELGGGNRQELRLIFPGRSNGLQHGTDAILGRHEENTIVLETLDGKRSRQALASEHYFKNELSSLLKKHTFKNVHIFGTSLGSSTALHFNWLLKQRGIPVRTMIWECYNEACEARNIALETTGCKDGKKCSPEEVESIRKTLQKLRKGVSSIRYYPYTMPAELRPDNRLLNNMQFCEDAYILTCPSGLNAHPFLVDQIKGATEAVVAGGMFDMHSYRRDVLKAAAYGTAGFAMADEVARDSSILHDVSKPGELLRNCEAKLLRVKCCPSIASDDDIINDIQNPKSGPLMDSQRARSYFIEGLTRYIGR